MTDLWNFIASSILSQANRHVSSARQFFSSIDARFQPIVKPRTDRAGSHRAASTPMPGNDIVRIIVLSCAIATSFFALNSCGHGSDILINSSLSQQQFRGCGGCPNTDLVGLYTPLNALPIGNMIQNRSGELAFIRWTNQGPRITWQVGSSFATQRRFYVDTNGMPGYPIGFTLEQVVARPPYPSTKFLTTIQTAHTFKSDWQTTAVWALAVCDVATDTCRFLYEKTEPSLGHNFDRKFVFSGPRIEWSPNSTPQSDTILFYDWQAPGSRTCGTRFCIQTQSYSRMEVNCRHVLSPDGRSVFVDSFTKFSGVATEFTRINNMSVSHLTTSLFPRPQHAWSADSRYFALLGSFVGPVVMPYVPDGDTLPAERRPCNNTEVMVFDLQQPVTDNLGRLQPNHRWRLQERFCLFTWAESNLLFNKSGNLLIQLFRYRDQEANIFEITTDGRIVRQVTSY